MNRTDTARRPHGVERGGEPRDPAPEGAGDRGGTSYRPPRLVEYGRLTDLTRFGGSDVVDSGALGPNMG